MSERVAERLVRLLGIVAYLDRHGEVPVADLAEHFGVPQDQVLADVDTLWVSGTPGYFPDDLIDFDATAYERGLLRLTQSRGMTRPLRLGAREAVTLVAALRALSAALGPLDPDRSQVLASALGKLTAATGEAAAAVDVRLEVAAAPAVVAAVERALREGRRLRIRYSDAADRVSEREVDPLRLVADDERTALRAWCHRAGGERTFRLDRVVAAEVLPAAVADHPATDEEFRPRADGLVTLRLRGRARWVAERVPVEAVREVDETTFEVDLRVVSPAWLRHLLLVVAEDVVAVEPPDAALDAASTARAALAAYAGVARSAPAGPHEA